MDAKSYFSAARISSVLPCGSILEGSQSTTRSQQSSDAFTGPGGHLSFFASAPPARENRVSQIVNRIRFLCPIFANPSLPASEITLRLDREAVARSALSMHQLWTSAVAPIQSSYTLCQLCLCEG